MSEACRPMENFPMMEILSAKGPGTKLNNEQNSSKLNKLLEYEHMVSSAETKCGRLKGQLDQIKKLYTKKAETTRSLLKTPLSGSFVESSPSKHSCPRFKTPQLVRQNSQRITTDTTGGALGTINNILAGITKTIPMPELFNKVNSYSSKSKMNREMSQEPLHGVEDIKIKTKTKTIPPPKSMKSRTSKSKITSRTSASTIFKRTRKPAFTFPAKRCKSIDDQQVNNRPIINRRSRKIVEKLRIHKSKFASANHDLVEIYHNNAVKECKSSESDVPKNKVEEKLQKAATETDLIPPLKIEDANETVLSPKGVVSCIYKNYTMPTISSRMKQVAKYYMNSFNIKSIPFCPATSTTASHNIGINIQQVMSMVKTKQPVGQLSPTLAYNIALAAGKWEDNPLALVLSNTSRTILSACPLSKNAINYQQLQEVAKTIPQDIIEEGEEELEEVTSPETQSMIITGPSGDVKVTNRKQTVWTADSDDKKCTCVPQKGMEFQEIINRFNGNATIKPKNKIKTLYTSKIREQKPVTKSGQQVTMKSTTEFTPLQNKEKKLKDVLGKLHDEFEKMTKDYDVLVKKKEDGTADEETDKQLESLDKELNSKEEEIVMVMTLYKEVLALKQQVKVLKDRTYSKESISVKPATPKLFNGNNNYATADILNKLLQRIQHFQSHYKRNPN